LAHALLYCVHCVAPFAMSPRSKPEISVVVALVGATLALVAAAWLLVRGADAMEAYGEATVAVGSGLSTTAQAHARGDDGGERTPRVDVVMTRERAETREAFAAAKAWSAFLAAIAVVAMALAFGALRRLVVVRRELEARLRSEQTHDPLTALPNRRFFSEWLAFAIAHARREQARVGVLFVDIDGCSAVVEHHGGPAAEALLIEIARRFRAASRSGDVLARLAPTHFALATPNAEHVRDLTAIAQRLRDVLDDPAQPPLADTPIGTSIGMAFYPEDAGDSAGVMAAANAAMFAARRAGRHHVAFNALAA
jgi:diguanylate cyclase (GGDEF)-like protein